MFARSGELGAAPSISIFEPGFLRTTLTWQRGRRLPPGAMSSCTSAASWSSGCRRPPTALEAYLELLEPSGLPWSVAVLGGDVVGCGLAERDPARRPRPGRAGGLRRAGEPSNADLLRGVMALIDRLDRRPAEIAETRATLGVPTSAPGATRL